MKAQSVETKERIAKAALFLFNSFGYPQVRLQHIADEAGISVGNLAYHFANKEALLEFFYSEIRLRRRDSINNLRMIPLFEPFHDHLKAQFNLQQQYRFFFSDTLELIRDIPPLRKEHRSNLNWQTQQIYFFIQFNKARGALKSFSKDEEIKQLAYTFCQCAETWFNYRIICGALHEKLTISEYRNSLWLLLKPYMSEAGLKEYELLD